LIPPSLVVGVPYPLAVNSLSVFQTHFDVTYAELFTVEQTNGPSKTVNLHLIRFFEVSCGRGKYKDN
jgi:hypothetical protein